MQFTAIFGVQATYKCAYIHRWCDCILREAAVSQGMNPSPNAEELPGGGTLCINAHGMWDSLLLYLRRIIWAIIAQIIAIVVPEVIAPATVTKVFRMVDLHNSSCTVAVNRG